MSAVEPAVQQQMHIIYRDHHRWLQTWLLRRLGCAADAADLSHDTFLRALTSRQIETVREPRAFLTTLVKRVLYTFWRRQDLERAYLDALATLSEEFAPSAEDLVLLREAIDAIDHVLDGLPLAVKHAFLLNRLDGLTHVEIASALDLSLATVERHVKRAFLHCMNQRQQN